jgi:2-C-methyl-D-erythritol 2,4-cyclodiphosphate synthase/2-C-methyl-D-erythritol 4-phosphate cytidylyltransferase
VTVWTIVVAAGAGERFGAPKQYAPLGAGRVVDASLAAARRHSDGVVLVVPADRAADPEPGADAVVAGGATRSASVRAGLSAVPDDATTIVVHDAARPFAGDELWRRVLAEPADAVVPGVAVPDTLREIGGATVDRGRFVAVQTPQAFRAEALRSAHAAGAEGTDDASLVEAAGGKVLVVDGEPGNRKITTPADLATGAVTRIGLGFDVHRWSEDPERPLVIGGVRFDGPGLDGHSDADVVAHACTDALLGAAGLGDIGEHFPDTDERWRGADSVALLAEAARLVREAGWEPQNVDCTVVLDAPKLAPARHEVQERLAAAVGAPVAVKGKRSEGVGSLGRGEGVAAWAVALVAASR